MENSNQLKQKKEKLDFLKNTVKKFKNDRIKEILKIRLYSVLFLTLAGLGLNVFFPSIGIVYHITTLVIQSSLGIFDYRKKITNSDYLKELQEEISLLEKSLPDIKTFEKIMWEQDLQEKIKIIEAKKLEKTLLSETNKKDDVFQVLKNSKSPNKQEAKLEINYELKQTINQTIELLKDNNMIDEVNKLLNAQKEYEEIYKKSLSFNIKDIEKEASENLNELVQILIKELENKIRQEMLTKSDNIKIYTKSIKR